MLKAATYARYSSDMQSDRSIEDQLRICNQFAARESFDIVAGYDDRAISGAVSNRPGYQDMLAAARRGEFQVLLVDELSRLGRSDTEVGRARDEFEFLQIRLVAIGDGIDTKNKSSKPLIGLKSMVNAMFIETIAHETHRSLVGKAMRGKVAGGRIYGYDNVPIEHPTEKDPYGRAKIVDVERRINEKEAQWVISIFDWYAKAYWSMERIAHHLNYLKVPSPHLRKWSCSTIRGMLLNELYVGQYVWNRTKKLKNKETGARKYVEKPRSEWIIKEMPELQLISDETWQAVQDRFTIRAHKTEDIRKSGRGGNHTSIPKYIFSGMLKCGCCGGSYIIGNSLLYRCATNKMKGMAVCSNYLWVPRKIVENRVLAGIKAELATDSNFEAFQQRVIKLANEPEKLDPMLPQLKEQLSKVNLQIKRMIDAIKEGAFSPELKTALADCEKQKKHLEAEIESKKPVPRAAILKFLPAMKDQYMSMVNSLADIMNKDAPTAQQLLKPIIGEKIVLHPVGNHLEAEIENHLFGSMERVMVSNGRNQWCPEHGTSPFSHRISLKYKGGDK